MILLATCSSFGSNFQGSDLTPRPGQANQSTGSFPSVPPLSFPSRRDSQYPKVDSRSQASCCSHLTSPPPPYIPPSLFRTGITRFSFCLPSPSLARLRKSLPLELQKATEDYSSSLQSGDPRGACILTLALCSPSSSNYLPLPFPWLPSNLIFLDLPTF